MFGLGFWLFFVVCLRVLCLRVRRVICWVLVLFVFVSGVSMRCFGAGIGDAFSAISDAEGKVVACYKAVSDAQGAGANVSDLLSVLNDAGWFLSRAKLAYNQSDFDSAVVYANNCSLKLNGFLEQAESLKLDAERAGYLDFMVNIVGSGVGAMGVVVGGFSVWVFLKKREETKGADLG